MKNKKGPLLLLPYLVLLALLGMLFTLNETSNTKEFTYNEFAKKAEKMDFKDVEMGIGEVVIDVNGKYVNKDKKETSFKVTIPKTDKNIAWLQDVLDDGKNKVSVYEPSNENVFLSLFVNFFPIILFGIMIFFMFSKMGGGNQNKAFEFAKSRAKIQGNIKTRFNDVAGADEEKEEVKEIIDYLKSPKKFSDMGAKIPKGMLMVGPPGTGKTLLAKAVAGEADVPFFSISGSDFVEMFVGTGASRVRDMFKKAKQAAPCIVFIDEIDAVGRQRGAGMGGGNDEREQTLNQLLVEMDGMEENVGIVVIAATNRPDVLDPALLRSGRFDRQITVSLPDKKGRTEILKVHARGKKLAKNVTLENLAKRTPGFSGADLANVLNEGAILAVRDKRKEITMEDLDEAIDRVMMGPAKKSKKYTDSDKQLVAYHEAGHAVIGIKLEDADMVQKVTIIPRGEAGGYNLMTPREEKYFHRKKEYMAQITGLLGGRVSEELVFGEISAGAVNDIERITKIAKNMVRVFGMSSLGPIQYADAQGNVFLGRDYNSGNAYSGEVAFEIDKEVRKIVNECHEQCKKILTENRSLLDLIAKTLIEEETLTNEQINNLVEHGTIDSPESKKEDKEIPTSTSQIIGDVIDENE
ncbi:cell division protease FtsH [Breznakia sp. PF5-3]|uniref:ATP-dependent zinc metalloprotease FtsH n=1 Tax=unclassified Breznakia TaxID=2623764 RepID=UPI002404E354|nr:MULTISPECIES: ATP-dependent zinc metalloprotease FtsH [unclassified Breznakia]MDF9824949.1 cell division protease FtsH [Breznakia sp. PM6-1]MDF9835783.1 cell division protease FtsH [Breznakia sp. PF5-3]MDF9837923.1 cell division protease FtsH [Breznakia sp. PFB2-8]MDF9859912.1 cell division protease FtsH [Breznakia sp. PH5-24]